jgi:tetratricopeptide (TPR) repeat protein
MARFADGRTRMKRSAGLIATIGLIASAAAMAHAQDSASYADCFGKDNERRISGCTALIESGIVANQPEIAGIYSARALAFSLKGEYANAIRDYDVAIQMQPNFPVALNNRAWAYFRWGKATVGLPDVEQSLRLDPTAGHSLDTRAHIRQVQGDLKGALADYKKAMYFGGSEMIKLYQCGLTEAGLYQGRVDGIWRRELEEAMTQCVLHAKCDPLPADEHCRPSIS